MNVGKPKYRGKANIYLVGFMGAGKTTVGRELARVTQRPFTDTDQMIEEQEGQSIRDIFASKGEPHFRKVETEVIAALAGSQSVVALGGGAFLKPENRRLLKQSGVSIYLKWDPEILVDRLLTDVERPLIFSEDESLRPQKILDLFNSRKKLYEESDYVIECAPMSKPLEIANAITERCPECL